MKNALWSVLFINLLAIGIGFGYIAMEPQKVRDVLSGRTQPADLRTLAPKAELPARFGGDKPPKEQASEGTAVEPGSSNAASRRPPARKPPARGESPAPSARVELPTIRAEYVGPALDPITEDPPAPELYPFRVDRRTFPTPDVVQVEMSLQNQSGYHWKTAYVVLKSTDYPVAEVFKVEEWAIEQVVGVDYKFPRPELYDRLTNLRVIRVSGERRESALADAIGQRREEIVRQMGTKENLTETRNRNRPTGLLSVWVGAAAAVQGGGNRPDAQMVPGGMNSGMPRTGSLRIQIPEKAIIPDQYDFSVPPTSPERREALELLGRVHTSARRAQTNIVDLADLLNQKSFRAVKTTAGEQMVAAVSDALREFNEAGIELTLLANRNDDPAIKQMSQELNRMAEQLVTQAEAVETSVRLIDPEFSLMSEE